MTAPILTDGPAGLTWTTPEPMVRTSHALAHEGRVWLVDPVDDAAALERAAALGEPAAVIQLLDRHNRDCAAIAARLGVPHLRIPDALPGTPFEVVPVLRNRLWNEVALWWPEQRTLVVAEAIGTTAAFAPGPAGAGVHVGLRLTPPRRLAAFRPDHLLVGHGPPIDGPAAATALREALERSRRDTPRALAGVAGAIVRAVRSR